LKALPYKQAVASSKNTATLASYKHQHNHEIWTQRAVCNLRVTVTAARSSCKRGANKGGVNAADGK